MCNYLIQSFETIFQENEGKLEMIRKQEKLFIRISFDFESGKVRESLFIDGQKAIFIGEPDLCFEFELSTKEEKTGFIELLQEELSQIPVVRLKIKNYFCD